MVNNSRISGAPLIRGLRMSGRPKIIGGDLAATGRYDSSFPLIPTSGMSGAPGA